MAAAKAVVDSYPWERALRELVTWIIERYIYLESYLENHASRDDSKPREVHTIPPPPKKRRSEENADDSDSSSDEEITYADRARLIALRRSPRKAKIWVAENLGLDVANVTPEKLAHLKKLNTEFENRAISSDPYPNPLLEKKNSNKESLARESKGKEAAGGEEDPYDLYQKLAGRKGGSVSLVEGEKEGGVGKGRGGSIPPKDVRRVNGKTVQIGEGSGTTGVATVASASTSAVAAGKKKSLLDEQPDARRLSFDSQVPSPVPRVEQRSPLKRPRSSASISSDTSDASSLGESDFKSPPPKKSSQPRRQPSPRGETHDETRDEPPAATHKSRSSVPISPAPPRDRTEDILYRIHDAVNDMDAGAARPMATPRPRGAPGRKGLGFAWSAEQEQFLIQQIEIYGPAWSDIARAHCKPGRMLEGRDQAKLKDKARNLKEKCLREGRKLPRHFENVTPYGNFTEATERMRASSKK